ncbi:Phenylacetate-coenzyme A ligase [Rubripirellula lacrimiformis]|uniref:Phenylacetate-coenzyme A ligase n=1 Tax=Rubripirellula lacrimiformis TaxID=1930273 RepID=A0A517NGL2_9BACT|nr:phenylacetate--CoA ligase family protein [Rubripirellula lacrimiformis]QDT06275.1 Phenylacetate-coenzyme A ligase [Rubripirellula lacrimiformis]
MRLSSLYGRAFQAIGLPLMLAPTRSKTISLARRIRRQQRWPTARIQEYQLNRLTELLQLAERESPFYRQRWRERDVSPSQFTCLQDLQRFPVTSKGDLETHFPDGFATESRRSKDWQYVGTRGTTRRVMVIHDFQRRDHERAAIMVAMTEDSPYRFGTREISIPPDACSVHCGIESDRADSVSQQLFSLASRRVAWNRSSISDLRGLVMDTWICPKTVLPPLRLEGADDELRECVAALRRLRPLQFTALPEYLRAIAGYIHRTGDLPPPIPIVRPMGANFPRSWRENVESAFRGVLREHYGSREMGPMAFDCRVADGMHLLMSQHVIEVVDTDDQAVPAGELGRVLVTDLHNHAMPIIRYDIGDLARIASEPCPCGRNTMQIQLEGRVDDALQTSAGTVLSAEVISNFFSALPEIQDFQLSENQAGKWTLRVVPAANATVNEDELAARFQAWAGDTRRISVRTADAIQPESSGKFRHSKRRPSRC